MKTILSNLDVIIAVITLAFSGGLILAVKKFIKEIKELVEVVKSSQKDGKITDKEKDVIMKELLEVIEDGFKLWKLIGGIFKKKVKK